MARRQRRRVNPVFLFIAFAVGLVLVAYMLNKWPQPDPQQPQQSQSATADQSKSPGPSASFGQLSRCGTGLDMITLIYRDGSPSKDIQAATFFPWGCPTQDTGCTFEGEPAYPDPQCSPGAIYDLTENINPAEYDELANHELICSTYVNAKTGNKDRRDVSAEDKRFTWSRYNDARPTDQPFETDHYIPLFMNGSNHLGNLIPQKSKGPYDQDEKEDVETYLKDRICERNPDRSFRISLTRAQSRMRYDWTGMYDQWEDEKRITV